MSSPLSDKAIFALVALFGYIIHDLYRWSDYSSCAAPVQRFLLFTHITLFLLIILLTILKDPTVHEKIQKFVTRWIHFFFTPLCIFLPIQGFLWEFTNLQTSGQNCYAVKNFFHIFIWIFCSLFIGIFFAYIGYMRLKNWRAIYQFRRRMMAFGQNPEGLRQLFLESGDVNNQVGLSPSELEKLQEKEYQGSLAMMLTEQTCPVCYEDYKTGDKVVALPGCKHGFHHRCATGWLLKVPLCPMCRGNVRNGLLEMEVEGQQVREDVENPGN